MANESSSENKGIHWAVIIVCIVGLMWLFGCGPTIRERALERQAIWTKLPGAPLENKGEGVYFVTTSDGEILQVLVTEGKVSGSSCAKDCDGKTKNQKK
ncbi:MAG: hypothetical protein AAB649_01400 [Patescibacteria group bacterium]